MFNICDEPASANQAAIRGRVQGIYMRSRHRHNGWRSTPGTAFLSNENEVKKMCNQQKDKSPPPLQLKKKALDNPPTPFQNIQPAPPKLPELFRKARAEGLRRARSEAAERRELYMDYEITRYHPPPRDFVLKGFLGANFCWGLGQVWDFERVQGFIVGGFRV